MGQKAQDEVVWWAQMALAEQQGSVWGQKEPAAARFLGHRSDEGRWVSRALEGGRDPVAEPVLGCQRSGVRERQSHSTLPFYGLTPPAVNRGSVMQYNITCHSSTKD